MRNLAVTHPGKSRGKTIDDEDLPNSLQTPSKQLAQDDTRLHQSRSFTNLNSRGKEPARDRGKRDVKPSRRRSTLPWSDPNPYTRQVKLEDIINSRMADTWFSLHCNGIDEPVYVSEVIEHTTNPSFKAFDLTMGGPRVSRLDHVKVKLYAKPANMTEYVFLLELDQHLQSLEFLGKSLESFRQPLPANAILFHFSDGVFGNLTDVPPVRAQMPTKSPKTTDGRAVPMASFDQLMRMLKLEECIQDAVATREQLESQMSSILEENERALRAQSRLAESQERLSLLNQACTDLKRQVYTKNKRKEELIASMKTRREAMELGRHEQEKTRSHLPDAQAKLVASRGLLDSTGEATKGQLRRICEDLLAIYPIDPIPDKPLGFTIRGLPLPNSTFVDIDRDAVAAALGHTAHLVYLLSFYLFAHLPYPVQPCSSTSLIQDPVSASLPQRTFPLYPMNAQYRFEYGVFLLNKNIEFLLSKQGLRVLDIRHTLPNLKYLLYVLTAGDSEIPARKAGGIRALAAGRMTPGVSRRTSEDSAVGGDVVYSRRIIEEAAKLNGGVGVTGDHDKPVSPEGALGVSPSQNA